jgi:hypothetical protein
MTVSLRSGSRARDSSGLAWLVTLAVRKRLVEVKAEDPAQAHRSRVYHVATTALVDLAISRF